MLAGRATGVFAGKRAGRWRAGGYSCSRCSALCSAASQRRHTHTAGPKRGRRTAGEIRRSHLRLEAARTAANGARWVLAQAFGRFGVPKESGLWDGSAPGQKASVREEWGEAANLHCLRRPRSACARLEIDSFETAGADRGRAASTGAEKSRRTRGGGARMWGWRQFSWLVSLRPLRLCCPRQRQHTRRALDRFT